MLKTKELNQLTQDELKQRREDLSREIFELTSQLRELKKIDQPHLIREKKKDRARVLTVLRQKQLLSVQNK